MINPAPRTIGMFAISLYACSTIFGALAQDSNNTSQFDEAKALQVFALMEEVEVGGPIMEAFLNAGGMFDIEATDGTNATYSERTSLADPVIKIPRMHFDPNGNLLGYFDKDGKLAHVERMWLMNDLVHEFFHAYVGQVVKHGHDPETKQILARGVGWLDTQRIAVPVAGGKPVRMPSRSYFALEALRGNDCALDCKHDFFEEYIGQILNRLAYRHQIIAQKLRKGITSDEAAAMWERELAAVRDTQFTGYYSSDADPRLVLANPPDFLVDHLVELVGLGFETDCAKSFRLTREAAEGGDIETVFFVGILYVEGHGRCVSPDLAKAVKWFRFAADQGHRHSQQMLWSIYGRSNFAGRDLVQARAHVGLDLRPGLFGNTSRRAIDARTVCGVEASRAGMAPQELADAGGGFRFR